MTPAVFTVEEAACYTARASFILQSASSSDEERVEACELAGGVLVSFQFYSATIASN